MRELRRSCAGERDAEELYQGAVRQAADIAMTSRKSVVLVTVDCLRADHVGFMGYDRPTTPFLDLLAAESFVVPAAVVAGGPTCYSVLAILASRGGLALRRSGLGLGPGWPNLDCSFK